MNASFLSQDCRQTRRGMVLFELIIALSVFALVAFSLVMALDSAFEASKARNEIDAAILGLENQLALVRATQLVPQDKDLPDDGSGLLYHVAILPEQLQDQNNQPVQGMYRVTITVRWKSGTRDEDRSVSELFYQP